MAHSHQHQRLAGAKPTCPQRIDEPGGESSLLRSDNENRRDDGTDACASPTKTFIRVAGARPD